MAVRLRHELLQRLAVWVGLFCLLAQLSSAMHMVLVEHVRCVAHGELAHGELAHAGEQVHDDHGSAASEAVSGAAAIFSSSSESDHGHEHCLMCFERREQALLPVATEELCVSECSDAVLRLRTDAVFSTSGAYAYAPKVSPPV